jgi:flagellar FliL protein
MAEEPEAKQEEQGAAPKDASEKQKSGKSPKMLILIMLAIVLAGGGFFGMKIMGAAKGKEPEKPKVGEVLELQEFLVNLKDKTWLKVSLALGVAEGAELHAAGGGGHGEGTATDDPKMRDIIIQVLTSKELEDIASPEGKEKLKQDILSRLNEAYGEHGEGGHKAEEEEKKEPENEAVKSEGAHSPTGPFLEVYFTAFSYQRY